MSEQCRGCGADLWEYPDRYDWCVGCDEHTVQWLIDAPEPKRGSWGTRKPAEYRCQNCGEKNF